MTNIQLFWYGIGFLSGLFLGFGFGVKLTINTIRDDKDEDDY